MVAACDPIESDNPNFKEFYLKFTDIEVKKPMIDEDFRKNPLSPNDCRLRDLSYSAPIYVNVEYIKGDYKMHMNGIKIGEMPIMLGSGTGSEVMVEVDRAAAIELALGRLAAGDTLLIAGKGHEDYQEVAGQRLAFSDRQVIETFFAADGVAV